MEVSRMQMRACSTSTWSHKSLKHHAKTPHITSAYTANTITSIRCLHRLFTRVVRFYSPAGMLLLSNAGCCSVSRSSVIMSAWYISCILSTFADSVFSCSSHEWVSTMRAHEIVDATPTRNANVLANTSQSCEYNSKCVMIVLVYQGRCKSFLAMRQDGTPNTAPYRVQHAAHRDSSQHLLVCPPQRAREGKIQPLSPGPACAVACNPHEGSLRDIPPGARGVLSGLKQS